MQSTFVLRGREFHVSSPIVELFQPFIRRGTNRGYLKFVNNRFEWDRDPNLLESLFNLQLHGIVPFSNQQRRTLLQEARFYKLQDCIKKIEEAMAERDTLLEEYADEGEVIFHIGEEKLSTFAIPKQVVLSKPTLFEEVFLNKIKNHIIIYRNTNITKILDFLIRNVTFIPNNVQECEEIRKDALFFKVSTLVKLCDDKIRAIEMRSEEEMRNALEDRKRLEEEQRRAEETEKAKVIENRRKAEKKKEEDDKKKADEQKKTKRVQEQRENEERKRAEEEEIKKAEAEAKRKVEDDRKKVEEERKRKEDREQREKEEKRKAEEEEQKKAKAEEQRKIKEARELREQEEKRKAEEEKQKKAKKVQEEIDLEERKRAEEEEIKKAEAEARKKKDEENEKKADIMKNRRKPPVYLGRHVHDDTEVADSQKALKAPVHLASLEKDREQREKRKQEWAQNNMQKDAPQTVIFISENGKECRLSRRIIFIQGSDTMKKLYGLPKDMDGRYKFGDKDTVFELLTNFMCQVDGFQPPKNVPLLRKLKNWANYFRMHVLEELCLQKNPALRGETQIKTVGGMGLVKSREDVYIAQLSGPLAVHDLNTSSMYTEKQPEVVLIVAPGEQQPTTTRLPLPRGTTQGQGAAAGTSQMKPALKKTDQPAPLPPHGRYNLRRGRDPSITEPSSKRSRVQSWHGA